MARRSTKARRAARRREINVEALGMIAQGRLGSMRYASAVETGTLAGLVRIVREEFRADAQMRELVHQSNAAKIDNDLRLPCDRCGLRRRGFVKVGRKLLCPACRKHGVRVS